MRRIGGGRLDGCGQRGALRERELRSVDAEVRAGGGLDAVGAAAKVDRVEIQLEDLVLAVCMLDLQSERDFLELSANCLFGAQMGQLGELLGDGAGALGEGAGFEVADQRAEDSVEVDAPVGVEAQILRSKKRLLCPDRYFGQGDDCPVFRPPQLADEFAVSVIQARCLRERVQAFGVEALPVGDVEDQHKSQNRGGEHGDDGSRPNDDLLLFRHG